MSPLRNSKSFRREICGFVLAGILLFAFPCSALVAKYHALSTGTALRLNLDAIRVDYSGVTPKYLISTPLNQISTAHMTGGNHFVVKDRVYVFMSAGPQDIWYPYAISRRPPEPRCEMEKCLVLKGRVTDIMRDSLKVRYSFESLTIPSQLMGVEIENSTGEIEIRIDSRGHSTLRQLKVDDIIADQRNLFRLAPFGSRNLGASKAPATAPPR